MSGEAPRTLQATRGGGVFNYLPFTTTFFMCACLGTFLLQFFLPDVASTGEFAITPGFIVFYFQWYRLISSAFFHGGLLHIGFNMMTLYALGTSLVSGSAVPSAPLTPPSISDPATMLRRGS